jgi:nucleotide-binding universal stress UspA family protein
MFKTIIWASDGSDAADLAFPYAKRLATGRGRRLIAVHCKELLIGRVGGAPLLADEPDMAEKIRHQVEEAQANGIDATFRIVTAAAPTAAHAIAEVAREVDADTIVAGTRGHTPVAGLLLGSVAQRLLHIAPCPVLVVPAKKVAADRNHGREAVGIA